MKCLGPLGLGTSVAEIQFNIRQSGFASIAVSNLRALGFCKGSVLPKGMVFTGFIKRFTTELFIRKD